MTTTNYQHTQFGRTVVWATAASFGVVCAIAAINPVTLRPLALVAVLLAAILWLFRNLTITIDEQKLRAAFGPGLIYRQIPLADIESAIPVQIKWWEGWGIHLSRFGWLYNVSGWDAVAIRLRDGRQLAIGTDQPEELAAAIRRAASAR
ncbi:MAG: hypothetical protein ACJ8JD_10665 [Chthoniobacterales bacterium]